VVAHPTKSAKDGDGNYKMPTLYDISGSANWYNKADLGVIVHRENEDDTLIKVQKSRYHDIIGGLARCGCTTRRTRTRRFELDLMVRRGEADRGRPTERVDCTAGHTTDAMIQAAQRIEAVVANLPPRDWWLLMELISPSIAHEGGWRGAVSYVTGEGNSNAQGAAVRAACVNLRDAYEKQQVVGKKAA
jgi:hypothetical protein